VPAPSVNELVAATGTFDVREKHRTGTPGRPKVPVRSSGGRVCQPPWDGWHRVDQSRSGLDADPGWGV